MEKPIDYLEKIKRALETLYKMDSDLFEGKNHEQTFSFRLAHYLAQELEPLQNDLFIDCEYHRDITSARGKKFLDHYGFFRPDIIYHSRGKKSDNEFCIEIKKGYLVNKKIKINKDTGDIKEIIVNDADKIVGMIREFEYKEGFCIYKISVKGVTILHCDKVLAGRSQLIKYEYKYNGDFLEQESKETVNRKRKI